MIGDTTAEAAAAQLELQRAMTGAQRVELALELSQMVRDLALAGLRSRHPGWTDRELFLGLMRQLYPSLKWPEGPARGQR